MASGRLLCMVNPQFRRVEDFSIWQKGQANKVYFDKNYETAYAFEEFACRGEDVKLVGEYGLGWRAFVLLDDADRGRAAARRLPRCAPRLPLDRGADQRAPPDAAAGEEARRSRREEVAILERNRSPAREQPFRDGYVRARSRAPQSSRRRCSRVRRAARDGAAHHLARAQFAPPWRVFGVLAVVFFSPRTMASSRLRWRQRATAAAAPSAPASPRRPACRRWWRRRTQGDQRRRIHRRRGAVRCSGTRSRTRHRRRRPTRAAAPRRRRRRHKPPTRRATSRRTRRRRSAAAGRGGRRLVAPVRGEARRGGRGAARGRPRSRRRVGARPDGVEPPAAPGRAGAVQLGARGAPRLARHRARRHVRRRRGRHRRRLGHRRAAAACSAAAVAAVATAATAVQQRRRGVPAGPRALGARLGRRHARVRRAADRAADAGGRRGGRGRGEGGGGDGVRRRRRRARRRGDLGVDLGGVEPRQTREATAHGCMYSAVAARRARPSAPSARVGSRTGAAAAANSSAALLARLLADGAAAHARETAEYESSRPGDQHSEARGSAVLEQVRPTGGRL